MTKETDLYPPVCRYFENLGYAVKGEVSYCDVVAVRNEEPPVIVELKTKLNLELILQAADRLNISEHVYIAFPTNAPLWRRHWRRVRGLCKRLGLGIITIQLKTLKPKVCLTPAPYKPRGSQTRKKRLLTEFQQRIGDHNVGGSNRQTIMTAYRQDALRCVETMIDGPLSLAEIRRTSKVARANSLLQKNHYGWFERVRRGYYQLSPAGIKASLEHSALIEQLTSVSSL